MLSLVVPAYREGATIASGLAVLITSLDALGEPYEVIVVSDGNVDATAANARAFNDPRMRVLEYVPNKGKGYAVRHGAANARGDFIAFIDADMEIHPDALAYLLARVKSDADVAVGSKYHPESESQYPLARRLQSYAYRALIRRLFDLDLTDTQAGVKVFRADALRALLPLFRVNRFAFDLEWLVMLKAAGAVIVEGPVRVQYTFESTTGLKSAFEVARETGAIRRRLTGLQQKGRIPLVPRRPAPVSNATGRPDIERRRIVRRKSDT